MWIISIDGSLLSSSLLLHKAFASFNGYSLYGGLPRDSQRRWLRCTHGFYVSTEASGFTVAGHTVSTARFRIIRFNIVSVYPSFPFPVFVTLYTPPPPCLSQLRHRNSLTACEFWYYGSHTHIHIIIPPLTHALSLAGLVRAIFTESPLFPRAFRHTSNYDFSFVLDSYILLQPPSSAS